MHLTELGRAGLAALIVGCGGSSPAPQAQPLQAGTYTGNATKATGVPCTSGCAMVISLVGSGPTYSVTGWDAVPAPAGTSGTVKQDGEDLVISLRTDGGGWCGNSTYVGTGRVDPAGLSFTMALTGPACGAGPASIEATLIRQ